MTRQETPGTSAPWIASRTDGVVLNIRVVPRASKTGVAGIMGDAIRIRLQAPPVEGKANKALIRFLSELLDIPKGSITILSGDLARNKRVAIAGVAEPDVRRCLTAP